VVVEWQLPLAARRDIVMPEGVAQVVTGVMPPELGEAKIREAWPSVASKPGLATLGRKLTATVVLAPLAWLLMSSVYFGKLLPFVGRRYRLTNRRMMIRKGWTTITDSHAALADIKTIPGVQVALADIDDVRMVLDANSDFFRAGNLELVSKGQVVLTLVGVPEPEGFRHAILNSRNAWVPNRPRGAFVPASAK
jgi:hypothetical protein